MSDEQDQREKLEAFYDGECPMCRSFVAKLGDDPQSELKDLHASRLPDGITEDSATKALHARDNDGNIYKGAKAVFQILKNENKLPWLVFLGQLPIISHIAESIYKLVAINRFNIFGPSARLFWCKILIALGFLIPMPITYKLWLGESFRFYPTIPIVSSFPPIPYPIDCFIFGALMLLLLLIILRPAPNKITACFLFAVVIYSLWDQSRWMPYYVEFAAMLLVLVSFNWQDHKNSDQRQRLNILGIILIGIWFWSGLHKINAKYIIYGYPWMMSPFTENLSETLKTLVHNTAYLSTLVETGGAICLLFNKTRKLGVLVLIIMHVFILVVFGPSGHGWNPSVWSWNIVHIALLILIFWSKDNVSPLEWIWGKSIMHRAMTLFFCLMPVLNYFGKWDDFLSHALYSWTTKEAEIELLTDIEDQLPEEVAKHIKQHNNRKFISIFHWSFTEFESPPYHADRVFNRIFGKLCSHVEDSDQLRLVIYDRAPMKSTVSPKRRFNCN